MVFKKAPKTQDAPSDEDIPRLRSHEEFWSQIYDYLKGQGFQLRSRYQPNRKLKTREEQIPLALRGVMDAIQISEGRKVCLKLMKPEENLNIRELRTERSLTSDTGVVPILDFIPLPGTENQIAVMPYLRLFDDPKFETVGEVTEAMSQYLQGLAYIHEHDMAHRDACWRNLMMDASELIPKGWHFARSWSQDGTKPIHSRKRSEVAVKYYFIDFELSVYVDSSNPNPLASGIVGQDRTVPEFQSQDQEAKYNPFKLDIYQLGGAFKRRLLEHYDGLDLLIPLVEAMTSEAPSDRPSAKEAHENLAKIVKDADLKSPISLKPGIRIWGSDPPRLETNSALRFLDSVRGWFSARLAGIRQRWS